MQSEMTRKEWRYARQFGVNVYPVKGCPDAELDYDSLSIKNKLLNCY